MQEFDFNLLKSKELIIEDILNSDIESIFPFFIFDEPFRKLLINLAKSDGKIESLLHRIGVGHGLGAELIDELIANDILYIVETRESRLKEYPKQKIKREYKHYIIEDKLFFKKPFYKFWFAFIEKNRTKENRLDLIIKEFNKWGYKLPSLVFEQLSMELLKEHFKAESLLNIGSYWDRYSEFDIYCNTSSGKYIVGECKYKNRPITFSEFNKLKSKVEQSNLNADYFALFSKSGFSKELHNHLQDDLLLFALDDFERLII